jgi:hypothetical protein
MFRHISADFQFLQTKLFSERALDRGVAWWINDRVELKSH